jgi:transglutaminase-like putative cysteine protease
MHGILLIAAFSVISCATLQDPSEKVQTLVVGEASVTAKNFDSKMMNGMTLNGIITEGITLSITNYQSKKTTPVKCDKSGLFYSTDFPAGVYYISNIVLEKTSNGVDGTRTFSISINPSAETLFTVRQKAATNLGRITWEADAKKNSKVNSDENYTTARDLLSELFPKSKWFSEKWVSVKISKKEDFDMSAVQDSSGGREKKKRISPQDFKDSSIEQIVRRIPQTITDKMNSDPDVFLKETVSFITKDSTGGFETVKILHDWVADNISYDAQSFFAGRIPDQSYKSVLRTKTAVCEGYANLFKKLCDIKGIPCRVVAGYSRGYGSSVYSNENPNAANHAWNIIDIDLKSYLIDTTWDAGTLENGRFRKYYGTGYLFADPASFVYSHFPIHPQDQLLSNPLDAQSFSALPSLNSNYFSAGITCQTKLEKINRLGNEFTLLFKVPAGNDIKVSLSEASDGIEMTGATFQQQEGDIVSISVALPKPSNYILRIFKHEEKDFGDTYAGCGEIGFIAENGSGKRYPAAFSNFTKGCRLLSPVGSIPVPGTTSVFRMKLLDTSSAFIVIDDRSYQMNSEGNGIFSVQLFIPENVSSISLARSKGGDGGWETMLQFPVQKK